MANNLNYIKEAAKALGIPDRKEYGDPLSLIPGNLYDYVIQRHLADRAGPHYDIRFGPEGEKLFSFASRYLANPGEKRLAVQQPLHDSEYQHFEGVIPSGYGKGSVSTHDIGKILITKKTPGTLHFTVAHSKYPERFVLVRGTGKNWLLVNTTPTDPVKETKVKYKILSEDKVQDVLNGQYSVSPKVDGASTLIKLMKDNVDLFSYRTSTSGKPIFHTEKVLQTQVPISKQFRGSILKGELYGVQDGNVIRPNELSGILNSSLQNALTTQKEKGIDLKTGLFDILQKGKQSVSEMPFAERQKLLKEVLQVLPEDKFKMISQTTNPQEAQDLWNSIKSKAHPLTSEGIVAQKDNAPPVKVKITPETKVYIRNIFPGTGKYTNSAGGFEYSHSATGPIIGRIGTGFSDEDRLSMRNSPQDWVNRVARVKVQEQYPKTQAYRMPVFLSRYEG